MKHPTQPCDEHYAFMTCDHTNSSCDGCCDCGAKVVFNGKTIKPPAVKDHQKKWVDELKQIELSARFTRSSLNPDIIYIDHINYEPIIELISSLLLSQKQEWVKVIERMKYSNEGAKLYAQYNQALADIIKRLEEVCANQRAID